MPDLKNLGVSEDDEEMLKKSYDFLANAIGADIVGKYIGDISIAQRPIYICTAASFFIAYTYKLTINIRLLYIYFLKWFAKILAWLSILAILVSLIGLGAYTWALSYSAKE